MKTEAIIIMFCILMLTVSGCMVIWTDDVFIGTLLKTVDANDIDLIAEPNYIQIGSGKSRTRNDNATILTPAVVVKTDSNSN